MVERETQIKINLKEQLKMEVKVTREFQGYINSIKFNDRLLFNIVQSILDEIEFAFGKVFTDEFISDFALAISKCIYKIDNCCFSKLERELRENVTTANSFENIVFTPAYFDYYEFNDAMKQGVYSKKRKPIEDTTNILRGQVIICNIWN